jgi:hypothetical protein
VSYGTVGSGSGSGTDNYYTVSPGLSYGGTCNGKGGCGKLTTCKMGKSGKGRLTTVIVRTMYGLLSNPLIIGLLSGLACNYFEISLWKPLDEMAKFLGHSVTPCALFALGAILAGFRKNIPWQEVPLIVILKTIVHPLVVWAMATLVFGIKEVIWIQVLVMLAAQPTGVNPFLFASRYNVGQLVASSAVFMSTVISIFTLSLLLALIR